MTKKEAKARKEAYVKALKEGRVVRYNDGCSFRSFATVDAAKDFETHTRAAGLGANIVIVPADYKG